MSSGASTWLHGQRKVELLTIADKVGLKNYDHLKKPELEAALDDYMRANSSTLSKDQTLQAYFKRAMSSATTETKTPRQRRSTKAKEDLEPTDSSEPETSGKALVARSPRTSLSFAHSVPLPPSPAVVAAKIDQQTSKIRANVAEMWNESGVVEWTDHIRDQLSSTTIIQTLALIVELYGMEGTILPNKILTTVPSFTLGSLSTPAWSPKFPDLFVMLKSEFWVTFSLWLATSVVLPMLFSYTFNLSLKAKIGSVRHSGHLESSAQYDPLSFNISKALIAWLVYAKGFRLYGWIDTESVGKLEAAMPGGYQGVLVGAGIGILTSLYEAVLRE